MLNYLNGLDVTKRIRVSERGRQQFLRKDNYWKPRPEVL